MTDIERYVERIRRQAVEDDCVFCQIVAGRAQAEVRWRWAEALAIAPLNPVTPGHTLIVPNTHLRDALEDPVRFGLTMRRAAQYAVDLVDAGLDGGYNLITSAGEVATQTVMHLHVHVVPRRPDDGLKLPWSP